MYELGNKTGLLLSWTTAVLYKQYVVVPHF